MNTTYRVVKVQIHTPVDGQSYKSVSWVWRVEAFPTDRRSLGAFLAGEDGKPLDFDTRAAAEVARFNADPHGWTDENGMRYRCGRCHEPLISLLPAELTSGTCRCGGLIEADPRNFREGEGLNLVPAEKDHDCVLCGAPATLCDLNAPDEEAFFCGEHSPREARP